MKKIDIHTWAANTTKSPTLQDVVALMELVDIPDGLSGVWDTAIAKAKAYTIPLDSILIFDQNTKTLYSLMELEGPFENGNGWQFNIPKSGRK